MRDLIQRPEPELKKLWMFTWVILFVTSLVLFAVLVITGVEFQVLLPVFTGIIVVFILSYLYIPAYYKTLEYILDNDAIRLKKGVFWRKRSTVPYAKVTNIDITQGPVERMYKIGRIRIQTAGYSQTQNPEIVIPGIRDCEALKDVIMSRIQGPTRPVIDETATVPEANKPDELLLAILNEISKIRVKLESK